MKWSVSHCVVLSVVQFTCLFLCHADHEEVASGSGAVPIDVVTNSTTITVEPTSTVSDLLVPFSADVDQPPPSVSIYVIPQVSSSLSTSLLLPNTVFGPSTTSLSSVTSPVLNISQSTAVSRTTSIYQTTSTLSQLIASSSLLVFPSPSSLPLVLYIISLTRVVVIEQHQLGSVLAHIRESLAGLLNLHTNDIFNVNILTQQERTKRQSSSEISFSAIEFSVTEIHSISVEQLQRKVRNGQVATIQLSPAETVQLKDIMASLQGSTVPEAEGGSALSSGVVAGIVLGSLAALFLLLLATLLIAFLVFKASRSKESQEIANLRNTYGYQYTSHAMSQWPPESPLL